MGGRGWNGPRRAAGAVGAVLALAAFPGCGGRTTYPVQGRVVWADGTPAKELAGGTVQFDLITDDGKARVSPHGGIEADGSYSVGTFKTGDGAPGGRYRVSIAPDAKPGIPSPLDPKFQDLGSSGLEVTVEPRENTIELRVDRARAAPPKGAGPAKSGQ